MTEYLIPDTVGFFCMNTRLQFFMHVGQLVMLPLSVDYLMPKKGEATLMPRRGSVTVLLTSFAFHFCETFKEVAYLRV